MSADGPALDALIRGLQTTVTRAHMGLDEAIAYQFRFADTIARTPRSPSTAERPSETAWVEKVLARFFEVEDAVLVQGAGTGAVRAMLNAGLAPGEDMLVHDAPVYRTTAAILRHMGLRAIAADYNSDITSSIPPGGAVYVQHAPQQIGDRYDVRELVMSIRQASASPRIFVDENGVAMRAPKLAVQLGATASAFSLLKLHAPSNIGCVLGDAKLIQTIRVDQSSQGSQVRGNDAEDALYALCRVPALLAIHDRVVAETAQRLNDLRLRGALPKLRAAVACQPTVRSVVLILDDPIAPALINALNALFGSRPWWAEESRYGCGPVFSRMTSTFVERSPLLADCAIRINPINTGPETIVRAVTEVFSAKLTV